jgi:hypothetical protein
MRPKFTLCVSLAALVVTVHVPNASNLSSSEGILKGAKIDETSAAETRAPVVGPLDIDQTLAGTAPVFVSDYFSFIGADGKGRVAFAIDNDRYRSGSEFTADAHVVLHDEHLGWIAVSGAGSYDNTKKELLRIPDSPSFKFSGDVNKGIILDSPRNDLKLSVAPMIERLSRLGVESVFSLGSAAATLKWRDRTIRGRVIYEYIFQKNLSPWYSWFSGLFYNDFQGLYLMTDDGGDFYFRTSNGEAWSELGEKVLGFQVLGSDSEVLKDLRIEVLERSCAFGLYRWPKTWRVSWRGKKGIGTLSAQVVDQRTVTNWLIGGFAMGVVTGELSYDGTVRPIYGLAELIR